MSETSPGVDAYFHCGSHAEPRTNEARSNRCAARTHESVSIVVVDDDCDLRDVVCEFLTLRGYSVMAFGNGADALAYLRQVPPPSLILLDVHMPVMDGYAFRDVQISSAELAAIPVVLISDERSVDVGRLAGADLLPKPFRAKDLVAAIERYC